MPNHEIILLNDWMTTPEKPFHSMITENGDHDIMHSHTFYEIFYILEGSIDHEINGTRQILHFGDIGFVTPNDVHSFYREPGNTCKHRDIIIRADFFVSVCDFLGTEFKNAYMNQGFPKVLSLPLDKIQQLEKRISNIILSKNINPKFQLASIRTLCISLLNCLLEQQTNSTMEYYPIWFKELLARFHMNDFFQSGLDEILKPFHFSQAYLCRTFHHYMGCTMTEYLNDIRLTQAAFQLKYTDEKITYICYSLGFSSVSYFNKIFSKKYSVSPSSFRKQFKSKITSS